MVWCRGYTPLDVCILEMQFRREQQDACGEGFMQHEDRYMWVIEHLLKGKTKRDRLACLPIPQSKLGCTCGQCLRGYFSPRMQWRSEPLGAALVACLCCLPSMLPCAGGGGGGGGGCAGEAQLVGSCMQQRCSTDAVTLCSLHVLVLPCMLCVLGAQGGGRAGGGRAGVSRSVG